MEQGASRACWKAGIRPVVGLVLDDRAGLRRGRSESELSEERRALLILAIDEMEDDDLELAARAVEQARERTGEG